MNNTRDIEEAITRTALRSKNILEMDDLPTRGEIEALFEVASYLEPIWRTGGLNLLSGKILATLFFTPSTRTRLGFEISMKKLGGGVIAESSPMTTSRIASGETLQDTLQTISSYVDIIALRHPQAEVALKAIEEGAKVPVISGGLGGYEHPVAGYTDLYTIWRTYGKIDGLKLLILGPDQADSRAAHSLAYGLSQFNTEIVLATETDKKNPEYVIKKLKKKRAKFIENLDPSKEEVEELVQSTDIVYCSSTQTKRVPGEDLERSKWLKYRIELNYLEKVRKKTGKIVRIMHPLPRIPHIEMDHRIDNTEYALYWKEVDMAQPIRMAMILSILYGS